MLKREWKWTRHFRTQRALGGIVDRRIRFQSLAVFRRLFVRSFANVKLAILEGGLEDGDDVVLIQEPWLISNSICGLRTRSHKLLMVNSSGRIRISSPVRNEVNAFILLNFSNGNVVTTRLEADAGEL